MGLNIKNEEVHGAVRDLARILGVSQTSAVEIAVHAKLVELGKDRVRAERAAELRRVVGEARDAYRGVDLAAIMDDLHDATTGLPR